MPPTNSLFFLFPLFFGSLEGWPARTPFSNGLPWSLTSACFGQWGSLAGNQREGSIEYFLPRFLPCGITLGWLYSWTEILIFWQGAFSLWLLATILSLFLSNLQVGTLVRFYQPYCTILPLVSPHTLPTFLFVVPFENSPWLTRFECTSHFLPAFWLTCWRGETRGPTDTRQPGCKF